MENNISIAFREKRIVSLFEKKVRKVAIIKNLISTSKNSIKNVNDNIGFLNEMNNFNKEMNLCQEYNKKKTLTMKFYHLYLYFFNEENEYILDSEIIIETFKVFRKFMKEIKCNENSEEISCQIILDFWFMNSQNLIKLNHKLQLKKNIYKKQLKGLSKLFLQILSIVKNNEKFSIIYSNSVIQAIKYLGILLFDNLLNEENFDCFENIYKKVRDGHKFLIIIHMVLRKEESLEYFCLTEEKDIPLIYVVNKLYFKCIKKLKNNPNVNEKENEEELFCFSEIIFEEMFKICTWKYFYKSDNIIRIFGKFWIHYFNLVKLKKILIKFLKKKF